MSTEREVVVLCGVRTAIGDYGGALKDVPPSELARRHQGSGEARQDRPAKGQPARLGNVIHTEAKDMYISRVACIKAGCRRTRRRSP